MPPDSADMALVAKRFDCWGIYRHPFKGSERRPLFYAIGIQAGQEVMSWSWMRWWNVSLSKARSR